MKPAYAISVFSLALAAGIAVKAWQDGTKSGLAPRERAGDSAEVLDGIDRLNERLDALEARLDEIPRLRTRMDEILRTRSATPSPADEPGARETSQPQALAELFEKEGAEEILEKFIADAYYSERERRRENEKAKAEAERREREELAKGPYGEYNYRVNSLTRELDLNPRQEQFLYQLLQSYDERKRAVREQIRGEVDLENPDPEAMRNLFVKIEQSRKELGEQFEADLGATLTAEQREIYQALPARDRRGEGGGAAALQIFSEGAADLGTMIRGFRRSEEK